MQIGMVALAGAQILYSVSYPYWSAAAFNWWAGMHGSQGPPAQWSGWPLPPPGSVHDVMVESVGIYGATAATVLIAIVVIIAAIRLWSWAFPVIGVLLALYSAARLYNLLVPYAVTLPPPPWGPASMPDVGFEGLFGLSALILWLCVIGALATRGPWGMRRVGGAAPS